MVGDVVVPSRLSFELTVDPPRLRPNWVTLGLLRSLPGIRLPGRRPLSMATIGQNPVSPYFAEDPYDTDGSVDLRGRRPLT